MAIILPPQEIQGRPITDPTSPDYGNILFKYPSGSTEVDPGPGPDPDPGPDPEPGYGLSWEESRFSGIDPTQRPADSGFIPLVVHADTKRIYCAKLPYSHEGILVTPSDSNDGLSPLTPKFSELAAVSLLEQGRSCHLYLRADLAHNGIEYSFDDTGSGTSNFRNRLVGGESFQKPTVITWYGTQEGNRPKVRPPIALGRQGGHSFLWWDGIHLYKREQDLDHPDFAGGNRGKLQYLNQQSSGIVVQDCELTGVELTCQNQNSGETMDTYIVHRCIGHYVYYDQSSYNNNERPSFAYVSRTTGVRFTENVSKWSGWHPHVPGAGSNQFNHWLYFGETDSNTRVDNAVVEHNVIFEPSAHAWQLRGGGTAKENLIVGATVGPTFGYLDRQNLSKGVVADGAVFHSTKNLTLKTQSMNRVEGGCQGSVCTTARWGHSNIIINPNVSHKSTGDVLAHIKSNPLDGSTSTSEQVYGVPEIAHMTSDISSLPKYNNSITITGRIVYHFNSSTEGDDLNLVDPTRDLGSYFGMLAGAEMSDLDAVEFLEVRPKSTWDVQYAPSTIHAWIYAGYRPAGEV